MFVLHMVSRKHCTVDNLSAKKNPRAEAGLFDLNYNPSRPTVTFDVPTKTQQVILSALITGGRENTHISQTSGKQVS